VHHCCIGPMWKLLFCVDALTQAWEALQRHSLYQNALAILQTVNDADDDDPSLVHKAREIVRPFLILKQVLKCAPLPAGRDDAHDDVVVDLTMQQQQDDDDDDDDQEEVELVGLHVKPQDYKLWEPGTASSNNSKENGKVTYKNRFVPNLLLEDS
jgi:hypothetical protein